MFEHREFLIRHPDLAIRKTDDRAAVETDHVMMVPGSTEDKSCRPIRLWERSTESRFGERRNEAVHRGPAWMQPRLLGRDAQLLRGVLASRGGEDPDEPTPKRRHAESHLAEPRPDRFREHRGCGHEIARDIRLAKRSILVDVGS